MREQDGLGNVLIVEDESLVRHGLRRMCEVAGATVSVAATVAEGRAALQEPGQLRLVLLDMNLPDGKGVSLVRLALARIPAPVVLVMTGAATRCDVFLAAQAGAGGLLEKPFGLGALQEAVAKASSYEPPVAALSASMVGRKRMRAVVEDVRSTMVGNAMARTGNNKVRAAKLLGVTRQAIQRFERE